MCLCRRSAGSRPIGQQGTKPVQMELVVWLARCPVCASVIPSSTLETKRE